MKEGQIDHELQLVRLIAASFVSAGSSWFVILYSRFSHFRFKFEHPDGNLTAINEAMIAAGNLLMMFPVVAAGIGFWLYRRSSNGRIGFEIFVSFVWLLSLGLAGFCVLMWQVQNVPVFIRMEWHF